MHGDGWKSVKDSWKSQQKDYIVGPNKVKASIHQAIAANYSN